jgi:phosphoribosylformylglycinamidine synthase
MVMDTDSQWNQWMKSCFNAIQLLVKERKILSGHDISDGGIITSLCEMCFGAELSITGNTIGIQLHHNNRQSVKWLRDTPGVLIEVASADRDYVMSVLRDLSPTEIGKTISEAMISGVYMMSELGNDLIRMDLSVEKLRKMWESTATDLGEQ